MGLFFASGFYYRGSEAAADAVRTVDAACRSAHLVFAPSPRDDDLDLVGVANTLQNSQSVGLRYQVEYAEQGDFDIQVFLVHSPVGVDLPVDAPYRYFGTISDADYVWPSSLSDPNRSLSSILEVTTETFAALGGVYGAIGGGEWLRPDAVVAGELRELWWANLFGPEFIERLGRDRLLTAPAWRLDTLSNGGVVLYRGERPMETGPFDDQLVSHLRTNPDQVIEVV